MGAANLAVWIHTLPEAIRSHLQISGCHCLKLCTDGAFDGAPYVKINDTIISAATPERIMAAIELLLQAEN
jgi:NADH:ubiquinone oxidoreductase subunit E